MSFMFLLRPSGHSVKFKLKRLTCGSVKDISRQAESFFVNQDRITKYEKLNTDKTENRGKEGLQSDVVFLNFQFPNEQKGPHQINEDTHVLLGQPVEKVGWVAG